MWARGDAHFFRLTKVGISSNPFPEILIRLAFPFFKAPLYVHCVFLILIEHANPNEVCQKHYIIRQSSMFKPCPYLSFYLLYFNICMSI